MLSKSKGQILRLATTMDVLFNWETPNNISSVISNEAMKAAIEFVEICNQNVNYLTGKDNITDVIEKLSQLHIHIAKCVCLMFVSSIFVHQKEAYTAEDLDAGLAAV